MFEKIVAKLASPRGINWLYTVATAALALLVAYGVIAPEKLPLWLALMAATLGMGATGTASLRLHGQRRDGIL